MTLHDTRRFSTRQPVPGTATQGNPYGLTEDPFLPEQEVIGERLIDLSSGAVIDDTNLVVDRASPGREITVADLFVGERPRHIKELDRFPAEKRATILSRYTGQQPELVTDHLGKPIGICGAVLYFSGPFKRLADNEWQDGYYTILLRTDIKIEQDLVLANKTVKTITKRMMLKCSGKFLAEWALTLMEVHGWYDWPVVIPVIFSQGSDKGVRVTVIEDEAEDEN